MKAMRSIIFTVTLIMLVTLSFGQQQLEQEQQKLEPNENQPKHIDVQFLVNAIEGDMPISLQHNIAACVSIIQEYYVPSTDSFMISTNIRESYLKWHKNDFVNNVLLNLTMVKVEIESKNSKVRDKTLNRKYNLIIVESVDSLR